MVLSLASCLPPVIWFILLAVGIVPAVKLKCSFWGAYVPFLLYALNRCEKEQGDIWCKYLTEGVNSTCFTGCSGKIWAVIRCYKSCCGARYLITYERQTFMICKQTRTNEWKFTLSSRGDLRVSPSPWRCPFIARDHCSLVVLFDGMTSTSTRSLHGSFPRNNKRLYFFKNIVSQIKKLCKWHKEEVFVIATWSRTRNNH